MTPHSFVDAWALLSVIVVVLLSLRLREIRAERDELMRFFAKYL